MRKKFFISFIVLLGTSFEMSFAQTNLKLGYFDLNYVLPLLPAYKQAETELGTFNKQLKTEEENKTNEFKQKVQAFQQAQNTMNEAIKEIKIKELQALEKQLYEFQAMAQQKSEEKYQQLMAPILEKIEKALQEVAKENNYTYIFDKKSLLFEIPEGNISDLVLKKMGVTPPPASSDKK
ncbi:MAG: OmpH family outer membrane protein [Microscillaceae bacterium]|nr:OmpH family outer membrane protein [Microscillaceae bacterium]MDW8461248.1 OmpH family outer membrane protein [Cytophagales bacterium]